MRDTRDERDKADLASSIECRERSGQHDWVTCVGVGDHGPHSDAAGGLCTERLNHERVGPEHPVGDAQPGETGFFGEFIQPHRSRGAHLRADLRFEDGAHDRLPNTFCGRAEDLCGRVVNLGSVLVGDGQLVCCQLEVDDEFVCLSRHCGLDSADQRA